MRDNAAGGARNAALLSAGQACRALCQHAAFLRHLPYQGVATSALRTQKGLISSKSHPRDHGTNRSLHRYFTKVSFYYLVTLVLPVLA